MAALVRLTGQQATHIRDCYHFPPKSFGLQSEQTRKEPTRGLSQVNHSPHWLLFVYQYLHKVNKGSSWTFGGLPSVHE
jgi:hypothetical protein